VKMHIDSCPYRHSDIDIKALMERPLLSSTVERLSEVATNAVNLIGDASALKHSPPGILELQTLGQNWNVVNEVLLSRLTLAERLSWSLDERDTVRTCLGALWKNNLSTLHSIMFNRSLVIH